MTVSSNGKYAFVGDVRWNRVVVVDADPASPTYNQVVTEVSSHRATGVAVTPDGKTLYVADSSPYIIDNALRKFVNVIDLDPASPTKGTVVASIAVPGEPGGLTMSPDGNTLYATTLDDVVAIDVDPQSPTYKQVLGTNAVSARCSVQWSWRACARSPSTK